MAGLNYLSYGSWSIALSNFRSTSDAGSYVAGYQSPASAMPTTGTAHYSSTSYGVTGTVYVTNGGTTTSAALMGTANLDVDFAASSIKGTLDHINYSKDGMSGGFNDIAVSANIASGTSTFSGTTAATTAGSSYYALKPTATGQINGAFYGPTPKEMGAIWTLSNGDGTGVAVGAVGAQYLTGSGSLH